MWQTDGKQLSSIIPGPVKKLKTVEAKATIQFALLNGSILEHDQKYKNISLELSSELFSKWVKISVPVTTSILNALMYHVFLEIHIWPGMVEQSCNSSTWEAEEGRFLLVWCQPGLHRKFQASHSYIVRPCLTKQKQTNKSYFPCLQRKCVTVGVSCLSALELSGFLHGPSREILLLWLVYPPVHTGSSRDSFFPPRFF